MPQDRRRLAVVGPAPRQQPESEHKLKDLALLLHLGVHAEKFVIDRLDGAAAPVFFGPLLPGRTVTLIRLDNPRIMIEVPFDGLTSIFVTASILWTGVEPDRA